MITKTKMELSKEQLSPFFKDSDAKADRIMQYYFVGSFFFGLFLASFYDTWKVALLVGSINLITYFLPKYILPNTALYRYIGSGVAASFVAQFIYQMHGMFEMHFFVFVASSILVAYQNWKLQLPLIFIVVVHHGTFAYLQYTGMKEVYFTQLDYMTLETFLFHGGLAGFISFLSGYWSYDIRNKTIEAARNSISQELQLTKMKESVAFAEQLITGNLEVDLEVEADDEMGKSMLIMRDELKKSRKREEEDKFTNTGLAEIGDILRRSQHDVASLCDVLVANLVKYLKANQGAIFIVEGEEQDDTHLVLKSHYAYERKKFYERRIEPGQGIVGQAFLEKDKIYLTEIPKNYISITSGLGEATPNCLLVIPLIYNNQVIGVLELASFRKFHDFEQRFLMKVGESIASTVISVKINERTNLLLQDTHTQKEQLQAQEEEMRQNMEEMEATQEEMHRKETELAKLLTTSQENEKRLQLEIENLRRQLAESSI